MKERREIERFLVSLELQKLLLGNWSKRGFIDFYIALIRKMLDKTPESSVDVQCLVRKLNEEVFLLKLNGCMNIWEETWAKKVNEILLML